MMELLIFAHNLHNSIYLNFTESIFIYNRVRSGLDCCPKPCPGKCTDCIYCTIGIIFPPLMGACMGICIEANCPGKSMNECA